MYEGDFFIACSLDNSFTKYPVYKLKMGYPAYCTWDSWPSYKQPIVSYSLQPNHSVITKKLK